MRDETRDRIQALAEQLGYVPNRAARTLVNRNSGLIGVVIPDMTNPFFAELAKGIEDEASQHGLRILITDTRGVETAEREAVNLFRELKVDGLIIPMARCSSDYYAALDTSVPFVHVNTPGVAHSVSCDMIYGSTLILRHLYSLGHRRIGFVAGPAAPGPEPKLRAYREFLDEHELPFDPDLKFAFDGTLASSGVIARQLLAMRKPPTAVFAWNDVNAIGVIHALRVAGKRVPQDLSIAGHDDIQLAGSIDPPLTTVRWPMYNLGEQSVRYLYSLGHGQTPDAPQVLAPELVIRSSTGSPK